MPIYTRAYLKQRISAGIKGKIGMLTDVDSTVNDAVRRVNTDIDLRSTKRNTALAPKLFAGINDYSLPVDVKGMKIIDFLPQATRYDGEFVFNSQRKFDISKAFETGLFTVDEYNGVKVLRISSSVPSREVVLGNLDSVTGDSGSWDAVGDGTNVRLDTADYMKGSASLAFDIAAGGLATAGIQNVALYQTDITDFIEANGAVFIWHYIVSPIGINSYTMRIGNSISAYYEKTVTATHFGTAFEAGWNLLRFDLTNLTQVGSVSNLSILYASVFMNKEASKISETGYKFDWVSLHTGFVYGVKYYSKYPWISPAGSYKELSDSDLDLVVADSDEIDLIIQKGIEIAGPEVGEYEIKDRAFEEYKLLKQTYINENPSEAAIISDSYYDFDNGNRLATW